MRCITVTSLVLPRARAWLASRPRGTRQRLVEPASFQWFSHTVWTLVLEYPKALVLLCCAGLQPLAVEGFTRLVSADAEKYISLARSLAGAAPQLAFSTSAGEHHEGHKNRD